MVVLVIMAIIFAVAVPRFELGEDPLEAEARRIMTLAQTAYSQAATTNQIQFLCFDLGQQRAWLDITRPVEELGEFGERDEKKVRERGWEYRDVIHPVEGMVTEGKTSFAFLPSGINEAGEIHLQTDQERELTVFLRPFVGRVEIKEGYLREEIE